MQEKDTGANKPSGTIRVLAESLLVPAIRIAREAAAENLAAGDQEVAKIFSDRAEELTKEAQAAGAKLNNTSSQT